MTMRRSPSQYLPGRPAYYADIDLSRDPDLELFDAFYSVMRNLSYREMSALARTFVVSYVTIWRWKLGRTAPRDGTIKLVIHWANQGKPLIKKQCLRFTMF